ncbi:hypothetical protein [Nonomuraea sp. PA05]|nr:hypothetical protein [Nonomuraea sp. PA05]
MDDTELAPGPVENVTLLTAAEGGVWAAAEIIARLRARMGARAHDQS